MRHTVLLFALVLGVTSSQIASAEFKMIAGMVTRGSDGDTVRVQPKSSKSKDKNIAIRMIGIDTPELHLPTPDKGVVGQGYWGEAAYKYLDDITSVGTSVVIESHGIDKYGRTLGRVYDGRKDVNLAMVKSGWAYPYIICSGAECNKGFFKSERVSAYLKACEDARAEGLGNFNPTNPLRELPFEFRLRMQNRTMEKYVGDFTTKKLYAPEKYKKVDVCKSIFFLTKTEARRAGYSE